MIRSNRGKWKVKWQVWLSLHDKIYECTAANTATICKLMNAVLFSLITMEIIGTYNHTVLKDLEWHIFFSMVFLLKELGQFV